MSASHEEQDLRLAEYVLGVLSAEERQALERQLDGDQALAQQLVAWQERLAPLVNEIPESAPPAFIWARLRDELGLPVERASRSVEERVPAQSPGGFFNSLALWRWLSAGSLVAVLVLALVLWPPTPPAPGQPALMTATLHLEGGEPAFTALLDAEHKRMVVMPVTTLELEGRVAELWLIAGDREPISMGLLPEQGAASMELPDTLLALAQVSSVFAVSLEPQGGSPTGQPTGPVVAQGELLII